MDDKIGIISMGFWVPIKTIETQNPIGYIVQSITKMWW